MARTESPDAFGRLVSALRSGGVLYLSFKAGRDEGVRHGRWFTDMDEAMLQDLIRPGGRVELVQMWRTTDVRLGRTGEFWLNSVVARLV